MLVSGSGRARMSGVSRKLWRCSALLSGIAVGVVALLGSACMIANPGFKLIDGEIAGAGTSGDATPVVDGGACINAVFDDAGRNRSIFCRPFACLPHASCPQRLGCKPRPRNGVRCPEPGQGVGGSSGAGS